jgi:hypothetical protein
MRRPAGVAAAACAMVMCGCLALGGTLAGVALGAGGNTIANAPQVPIGQTIVSGGTCSGSTCDSHGEYYEYYRIAASANDTIAIDYKGLPPSLDVLMCLWRPSVTDATHDSTPCLYQDEGTGLRDWVVTVPSSGNWTIGVVGGSFAPTLSYQLTVRIHHATAITLPAPTVSHNGTVTGKGTITGATGGTVAVFSHGPGHSGWTSLGNASIGGDGSFRYKTKASAPGTYRIKAVFKGDTSHQPSSAVVAFKVS